MSHIEKEKLIKADIASIEKRVRHAFSQGYDLGFKDGKKKAKPQEPVLNKIRAEIQDIAFDWQEIDGEHESFMVVDLNDVLQIIDKYRGR